MSGFAFWVALSLLVGYVAQTRGFSFWRNFWLAFFLSPVLAAVIVFVRTPDLAAKRAAEETEALAAGDTRKCPHCAELIKAEARVCRFCGRDVEPG